MKIDSYKFIKYVFYILLIVSLFLSIKSKVYADEIRSLYVQPANLTNNVNTSLNVNSSSAEYTFSFANVLSFSNNVSQIFGNMYVINNTATTPSITSSDTITCTDSSQYTNSSSGRTDYADGSHSNYTENGYLVQCDEWTSSAGTIISNNIDNSPYIEMQLITNNNTLANPCIVDTFGNFTCSIIGQANNGTVNDYKISGIRFRLHRRTNVNTTFTLGFSRNMFTRVSDTQTIINNNNQNTTTINNSIQDTNNTIKDDNVSGNNSSDTISSIGDTFDTENDFLLGLLTIPYNFFNGLINIFENNCTSLNLGSMFGEDLVFPCLSLSNLLGDVFTNVIDVIFCGVIMSAFLRRIVKYYQALLSLDERATQIGGVKIW